MLRTMRSLSFIVLFLIHGVAANKPPCENRLPDLLPTYNRAPECDDIGEKIFVVRPAPSNEIAFTFNASSISVGTGVIWESSFNELKIDVGSIGIHPSPSDILVWEYAEVDDATDIRKCYESGLAYSPIVDGLPEIVCLRTSITKTSRTQSLFDYNTGVFRSMLVETDRYVTPSVDIIFTIVTATHRLSTQVLLENILIDFPKPNISMPGGATAFLRTDIINIRSTQILMTDVSARYSVENGTEFMDIFSPEYTEGNIRADFGFMEHPRGFKYTDQDRNATDVYSTHMFPTMASEHEFRWMITGKMYAAHLAASALLNYYAGCMPYVNMLGMLCSHNADCCLSDGLESWFVDTQATHMAIIRDSDVYMEVVYTGLLKIITDAHKRLIMSQRSKFVTQGSLNRYRHSIHANGDAYMTGVLSSDAMACYVDGCPKSILGTITDLPRWSRWVTPDRYLVYDYMQTIPTVGDLASLVPVTMTYLYGVYRFSTLKSEKLLLYRIARGVCRGRFHSHNEYSVPCAMALAGNCESCTDPSPHVSMITGLRSSNLNGQVTSTLIGSYSPEQLEPPSHKDGWWSIEYEAQPAGLCLYSGNTATVYSGSMCYHGEHIMSVVRYKACGILAVEPDAKWSTFYVLSETKPSCKYSTSVRLGTPGEYVRWLTTIEGPDDCDCAHGGLPDVVGVSGQSVLEPTDVYVRPPGYIVNVNTGLGYINTTNLNLNFNFVDFSKNPPLYSKYPSRDMNFEYPTCGDDDTNQVDNTPWIVVIGIITGCIYIVSIVLITILFVKLFKKLQ